MRNDFGSGWQKATKETGRVLFLQENPSARRETDSLPSLTDPRVSAAVQTRTDHIDAPLAKRFSTGGLGTPRGSSELFLGVPGLDGSPIFSEQQETF